MRRTLFRLLAATGAVLATATALPAAPASAASPALRLHFPDLSVIAGPAKINPLFAWVDVPAGGPAQIGRLTVTVDTADLADIADVEVAEDVELGDEPSCARAGAVITCTLADPVELEGGTNLLPLLAVQVDAKAGAAQDSTGELKFTVRADDGPVVSTKSSVTIGEGVDLADFETKPVPVAPGATVSPDLRVANVGEKAAHGVVLVMLGWDSSLRAGDGFGNCTYGLLTVCTFDDELATGTTYELSTPMRLKMPADAAPGSTATAIGSWYTPSDFKELLDTIPGSTGGALGPKGTGPAVQLRAVAAKKTARLTGGQVDTNPDNNVLVSEVVVSGSRTIDLAAVGATVTGTAGDRVHTRIGFVNNGPGTLYHWTFDNNDPATVVTVPAGLRVTDVDDRCSTLPSPVGGDTADDYLCFADADRTKAKARVLYDFTFQVRDHASDATGQVQVDTGVDGADGLPDRDKTNDTAAIEVNLSGGSGSGGGLPVTGANAGLLGAGGVALLLAGALGLLLVRRRRMRFTA
jgi:LPXTG-motif cell wall-anchored protein